MNSTYKTEIVVLRFGVLLLMMSIPAFVWGQHKNEPSKPSAAGAFERALAFKCARAFEWSLSRSAAVA